MITMRLYYRSADHFSCDITPKRTVRDYELEISDYGGGYASIDGVLYPRNDKVVVFAKPGQERFTIGTFNCYAIHFTCRDADLCRLMDQLPSYTVVSERVREQMLRLYDKTAAEDGLAVVAALAELLELLRLNGSAAPEKQRLIPPRIRQVKEYIDSHYTEAIEPNALKRIAGWSVNYVRKQFSDSYGIGIGQYITELRLSRVRKALASEDRPLCDIAYEAGFNSQSHMNYMFKRRYGVSPLRYKTNRADQRTEES